MNSIPIDFSRKHPSPKQATDDGSSVKLNKIFEDVCGKEGVSVGSYECSDNEGDDEDAEHDEDEEDDVDRGAGAPVPLAKARPSATHAKPSAQHRPKAKAKGKGKAKSKAVATPAVPKNESPARCLTALGPAMTPTKTAFVVAQDWEFNVLNWVSSSG